MPGANKFGDLLHVKIRRNGETTRCPIEGDIQEACAAKPPIRTVNANVASGVALGALLSCGVADVHEETILSAPACGSERVAAERSLAIALNTLIESL
jgi:hypothetical protein